MPNDEVSLHSKGLGFRGYVYPYLFGLIAALRHTVVQNLLNPSSVLTSEV